MSHARAVPAWSSIHSTNPVYMLPTSFVARTPFPHTNRFFTWMSEAGSRIVTRSLLQSGSTASSGSAAYIPCGSFDYLRTWVARIVMGSYTDFIIPKTIGNSICNVFGTSGLHNWMNNITNVPTDLPGYPGSDLMIGSQYVTNGAWGSGRNYVSFIGNALGSVGGGCCSSFPGQSTWGLGYTISLLFGQ
jgi:hypothetical protein